MNRFVSVAATVLLVILLLGSERWSTDAKRVLSRRKRVIGGNKVMTDEEQSWLVSIRGHVSGRLWWKRYVFCGASVVSDTCVITAAHCVEDLMKPSKWTIRLASRKLKPGVFDRLGHIFGSIWPGHNKWKEFHRHPSSIVIHPSYQPSALWVNDIAIMKVSRTKKIPVDETDQIGLINIPDQGELAWPQDNQLCAMLGWGCDKKGGRVVKRSRSVTLPILSDARCQKTWGVTRDNRICAGRDDQNIGICPGDSGGPLVCKKNNKLYQAGIASFTSGNNPGQKPGGFTRVSAYSDWIKKECGL